MREPERPRHDERRALAFAFAARGHASAVLLDEVSHEREPEAEARKRARARAVALSKSLEDERQDVRGDAHAAVADGDLPARADPGERHVDAAAARRELHGVRQEVPDHLLEPRLI